MTGCLSGVAKPGLEGSVAGGGISLLLLVESCTLEGRGVAKDGTDVRGFGADDGIPNECRGAFGVVVTRGGLPPLETGVFFCGLMGARIESSFAVTPIYLLAREPAVILDCAMTEASAEDNTL